MADTTSVMQGLPAWRFAGPEAARRPSLSEVHASIPVPQGGVWLRRFLAFAGPGYMISVGYMDPGKLGHRYRRRLAVRLHAPPVILLSNLMAILLEALAVRSASRPAAILRRHAATVTGAR